MSQYVDSFFVKARSFASFAFFFFNLQCLCRSFIGGRCHRLGKNEGSFLVSWSQWAGSHLHGRRSDSGSPGHKKEVHMLVLLQHRNSCHTKETPDWQLCAPDVGSLTIVCSWRREPVRWSNEFFLLGPKWGCWSRSYEACPSALAVNLSWTKYSMLWATTRVVRQGLSTQPKAPTSWRWSMLVELLTLPFDCQTTLSRQHCNNDQVHFVFPFLAVCFPALYVCNGFVPSSYNDFCCTSCDQFVLLAHRRNRDSKKICESEKWCLHVDHFGFSDLILCKHGGQIYINTYTSPSFMVNFFWLVWNRLCFDSMQWSYCLLELQTFHFL